MFDVPEVYEADREDFAQWADDQSDLFDDDAEFDAVSGWAFAETDPGTL